MKPKRLLRIAVVFALVTMVSFTQGCRLIASALRIASIVTLLAKEDTQHDVEKEEVYRVVEKEGQDDSALHACLGVGTGAELPPETDARRTTW